MDIESGRIAAAITATVAPFMPFLMEIGKTGTKKLAEVVAEEAGEAGWEKAQALWARLMARFGEDPEVQAAAAMVAANPRDETRQTLLAEELAVRLQHHRALAKELLKLLDGEHSVQQVLADRSSWVEKVSQRMKGVGKQVVQASDDSVVKGIQQVQE